MKSRGEPRHCPHFTSRCRRRQIAGHMTHKRLQEEPEQRSGASRREKKSFFSFSKGEAELKGGDLRRSGCNPAWRGRRGSSDQQQRPSLYLQLDLRLCLYLYAVPLSLCLSGSLYPSLAHCFSAGGTAEEEEDDEVEGLMIVGGMTDNMSPCVCVCVSVRAGPARLA